MVSGWTLPRGIDHEFDHDLPLDPQGFQSPGVPGRRLRHQDGGLESLVVRGRLVDRIQISAWWPSFHTTGAANHTFRHTTLHPLTGEVTRVQRPLAQVDRRNHLGDVRQSRDGLEPLGRRLGDDDAGWGFTFDFRRRRRRRWLGHEQQHGESGAGTGGAPRTALEAITASVISSACVNTDVVTQRGLSSRWAPEAIRTSSIRASEIQGVAET